MCHMTPLSGNPKRTGLTGRDRPCTPTDLRRSRQTFGYRDCSAASSLRNLNGLAAVPEMEVGCTVGPVCGRRRRLSQTAGWRSPGTRDQAADACL